VLTAIREVVGNGIFWATAGHIPAVQAVVESAEYQAMEPNATYAVLTESMIYDPKSPFAGVAGPMFTAAGNAFTAAANGEMDAADAVADMKAELDGLQ
jgi:multiple sugar transport system substrate-binding protein